MCGNFGGGFKEAWFSYGLLVLRRQGKFYVTILLIFIYKVGIIKDEFGAGRK